MMTVHKIRSKAAETPMLLLLLWLTGRLLLIGLWFVDEIADKLSGHSKRSPAMSTRSSLTMRSREEVAKGSKGSSSSTTWFILFSTGEFPNLLSNCQNRNHVSLVLHLRRGGCGYPRLEAYCMDVDLAEGSD